MERIGSQTRHTLEEAHYRILTENEYPVRSSGCIVVQDEDSEEFELFRRNDDFAGAVLTHRGKQYEFIRTIKPEKVVR